MRSPPRGALAGFFVQDYTHSNRGDGMCIKVVRAMELRPRREGTKGLCANRVLRPGAGEEKPYLRHSVATKWFLNVRMLRSAVLRRCERGGTY